jgi:hypothetical protein
VACRPLVSAQPGCQVADGDGDNEDADGAADHGLGLLTVNMAPYWLLDSPYSLVSVKLVLLALQEP